MTSPPVNASVRPIMDTFLRTPFVANEPVDADVVREIIPRQVQVAFVGDGPAATRKIVPLTAPARELLNGPHRDAANRFFKGVLSTIDGREGVSRLKGMSLATDANAFATNLMMSNIENGFIRDSIALGKDAFIADFQAVANETTGIRAQNSGWLDMSPRLSESVLNLIRHGASAGTAAAEEVAQVVTHEAQHSVTPIGGDVDRDLVWLEEGIAETLSWWPGAATRTADELGVRTRPGWVPDPFTMPREATASWQYRQRQSAVRSLLDLAGVTAWDEQRGAPTPGALATATQLLQGEQLEQVPKNLARAIARHHRLDPSDVEPLAELIVDTRGESHNIAAIRSLVTGEPVPERAHRLFSLQSRLAQRASTSSRSRDERGGGA